MFAFFKTIFSGRLNRKEIVRPLSTISLWVLAIAFVVWWGAAGVWLPDMEALTQHLQAARESGNAEQITSMQRAVVLGSSMYYLLSFIVLYGAWCIWSGCVSPSIVRRLRDAGKNTDRFCLALLPMPLPAVYYHFARETDKLLSMPPEQILDIAQNAWLVCLGAAGISVLLTLAMAFGFPSAAKAEAEDLKP